MTELYLVRHGETEWNASRRIQGITDVPLNDTGRAQARRTGTLLAARRWDAIVSSPLSRALETAHIIAREARLAPPVTLAAMIERHYGEAEGLDYRTLDARFPPDSEVPGRESRAQVARRVLPALVALCEQRPGQRIIVVTHGGVIRTVVNATAPADRALRGVPITNGSVHSFRCTSGGIELVAFDDPIDEESVEADASDFESQNAIAARADDA